MWAAKTGGLWNPRVSHLCHWLPKIKDCICWKRNTQRQQFMHKCWRCQNHSRSICPVTITAPSLQDAFLLLLCPVYSKQVMGLLLWDLPFRLMNCKTSHMFKWLYSFPPVYISVVNKVAERPARIHSSIRLVCEMRPGAAPDTIISIKAFAPDVSTRCLSSPNIWSPGKLLHSLRRRSPGYCWAWAGACCSGSVLKLLRYAGRMMTIRGS